MNIPGYDWKDIRDIEKKYELIDAECVLSKYMDRYAWDIAIDIIDKNCDAYTLDIFMDDEEAFKAKVQDAVNKGYLFGILKRCGYMRRNNSY